MSNTLDRFEFQYLWGELEKYLANNDVESIKAFLETGICQKKDKRLLIVLAKTASEDGRLREETIETIIEGLAEAIDIKKFTYNVNKKNDIEAPDLELMWRFFCFNACPASHKEIAGPRGFIGGLGERDFRYLLKIMPELPAWDDRLNAEVVKKINKIGILSTPELLGEIYRALR